MKRIGLSLLLVLLASPGLRAQAPYLVKDINVSTVSGSDGTRSSSPHRFFRHGSRMYFIARHDFASLWAIDIPTGATTRIASVGGSLSPWTWADFIAVNGIVLFNGYDSLGEELWVTDGTAGGTHVLANINPSGSSMPGDRIVYHGKMFFAASENVSGRELWITDGTQAGTRLFKDLVPGPNASVPHSFVVFNDLLYFATEDALWKSDGTESGTVKVMTIRADDLTVLGSRLFFAGSTSLSEFEVWVSDGTEAGTRVVAHAGPPLGSIPQYGFTAFGDRVLFFGYDTTHGSELWISDGTEGGTRVVRDIDPGKPSAFSLRSIAVLGNTALFPAKRNDTGAELWKTDGTEAGTTMVSDIAPGALGSSPINLRVVGSNVLFAATNNELWMSDGSASGTHLVKTAEPRPAVDGRLTEVDGVIYFSGSDALHGYEPWKSDGTDSGTLMVANVAVEPAPSSRPHRLTGAADWLYFAAWDGIDTEPRDDPWSLWRTDGTPEGTLELTGGATERYTPVGRSLFFWKNHELWSSDGTPEGTAPATEFESRFPDLRSIDLVIGDRVFATVANSGFELWATTTAPNTPAVPISTEETGSIVEVAGRAMFFRDESLWISDGTSAGTWEVKHDLGGKVRVDQAAAAGGLLYFVARSDNGETKLWKSDGTFEGTVAVKTLPGSVERFMAAGRNVYFTVIDQLWVSDGTEAGTKALPATVEEFVGMAALGEGVVFASREAATGAELWRTDGTPEGTRLVRDIRPGASGSNPSFFVNVAGAFVYFTASDGVNGDAIWVTDGTAEGTTLAADVEPEPSDIASEPRSYLSAGDRLFFTATTTATGNELWALPLTSSPRLTIDDLRIAEGDAGTTSLRFTATLSAASTRDVTAEWATSDGSATAGSDYDATSGTLTFAVGETSKSIEVSVRGDAAFENNETFFIVLRNASRATLARESAVAIIEDDDRSADIAASFDFASISSVHVRASNAGPSTATNLEVRTTQTPSISSSCDNCRLGIAHLTPGQSELIYRPNTQSQSYATATVIGRERDPQLANNTVAWTVNNTVAMDRLYLTPGADATVWFVPFVNPTSVTVESSNPAVVSVPGTVPVPDPQKAVSFIVRGLSVGSATIRIFSPVQSMGSIVIDVVENGTTPRWPGAVNASVGPPMGEFNAPREYLVTSYATAPNSGARPTGVVTFSANGRELARVTLTPGAHLWRDRLYVPELGANELTIYYEGDANFLPQTSTLILTATRGFVTVDASAYRSGRSATIRVRYTGSPMAAPTGTVTVSGAASGSSSLTTIEPGVAEAVIPLAYLPPNGPQTVVLSYSGDTHYNPVTRNVVIPTGRARSVRH